MSTGQQNQYDLSFERINAHIRRIDLPALITATAVESQPDRGKRLIAAYAAIRPILVALSAVPIIPSIWRTAMSIFTPTLDEVTLSFKAGKDLAVGDGGTHVEMEPKLPTD